MSQRAHAHAHDDEDVVEASVDLRLMNCRIEDEDGDLVIVLHDGDTKVTLNPGVGGSAEAAYRNARRAARLLDEYADRMGRRGPWGTAPVWTAPEVVHEQDLPPANAFGL